MTSDDPHIPEDVQQKILELAERAEAFVESADNGGSWFELTTWLYAMRPRLEALIDIGMDGVRRTARMDIAEDVQQQIMDGFSVPDNLSEEGDPQ